MPGQEFGGVLLVMGTCKLQGVNPQEWLTDVLRRIRTHPRETVHELLPHQLEEDT